MIYINGKLLDLRNKNESYKFADVVKDYHETIESLRKRFKDNILFKSIYEPQLDPQTGNRRPHKPFTVSYKQDVRFKDDPLIQKWIFSDEGIEVKNNVALPRGDAALVLSRGSVTLSLNEKPELIYFLLHSSKVKRGILYVYDENDKQEQVAKDRAAGVKLTAAIYDEQSPLANKEFLVFIARKWGVPNVESMKQSTIQNILYDKILEAEKQKQSNMTDAGLHTFLTDVYQADVSMLNEDIQLAIDKGLLRFERNTNEWQCFIERDQPPWVIMRVDSFDITRSRDKLAEHLNRIPKDAEKLNLIVSGNAVVTQGKIKEGKPIDQAILDLDVDDLEDTKYPILQKAHKHYGLGNPAGVRKPVLIANLKEYLEKQTQSVN
jgi:hypothetical protein